MLINVKKAFTDGTRINTGGVSPNYWQNRSSYNLKEIIDLSSRTLIGKAEVLYFNESPRAINQIVFHAYHNYYQSNAARLWPGFYEENSGMIIESLYVDDRKVWISVIGIRLVAMVPITRSLCKLHYQLEVR